MTLNQSLVFPNEIKDEVVKHFSPGTLATLCCVSKDLNKVRLSTLFGSSVESTIMKSKVVYISMFPEIYSSHLTSCPKIRILTTVLRAALYQAALRECRLDTSRRVSVC